MYKKVVSLVLVFALVFTSLGLATAKGAVLGNDNTNIASTELKKPVKGLTPAERRKLGYVRKATMGIEYKTNLEAWKKYDDFVYVDYPAEGDTEDNSKAIYDGKYVSFISSDLLKKYDETSKITDRAKRSAERRAILSKGLDIYSIIIYRSNKLPKEEQIKKDVKLPNYFKLGEDGGYAFYFGYGNFNDKDLTADDKVAYKALYDDAMIIADSMIVFRPIGCEEGIKSLGKLQFKLKDLEGKEVTESIFKQNKITMVNLWATYCGYCIDEMPYIQELANELKDKKFGVVGIAGDVYSNGVVDEKLLEKAKKIVNDTGVKYQSLIPDDNMKFDGIMQYLLGYPTTIFVDSEGNIVGDVIIGEISKVDYEKRIIKLLGLTPEEKRKMGYVNKPMLGMEYKTNTEAWKKYDDFVYTDYPEEGDTEDNTKAIFDGKYVSFISSELLKQYDETAKITDKAKRTEQRIAILSKGIDIYSMIIYRKDKLPNEEQIKKDIKLPNYFKLGEDGGYVFYFGYAEYNDKGLPETDKAAYKALYDDAEIIRDSIQVFKPISSAEGIKSVGKLQFKLKDLDGKEVTESIFKDNKITMVNLWATYCGYCIEEMPSIQELSVELKDQKFAVVGIVGDVYSNGVVNEKLLEKAKKIVNDTGVKYQSLIPDDNMKYNSIMQYLVGYPTTIFVDSKGNIVGDVIIGSMTKEEFKKAIEGAFNSLK